MEASLIEPVDVPGVIEWSTSPGPAEAAVRQATADMMTLAVLTGAPSPGQRAWKRRHQALVSQFLSSADPEHPAETRRRIVERERQQRWAEQQGPTRHRLFATLLAAIDEPIEVPSDAAELVEPLTWLTVEVGDGVKVSKTGTLNRALVQAIEARYQFGFGGKPPRSEAHVFQVTELRELARRLGLVRRRGTTLATTALGKKLIEDPAGMWARFVERALELPAFDRCVAETWLAAQVVDGPIDWPADREVTARAAHEQGWRTRDHGPVEREDTNGAVNTIAWSFRLLLLLGHERQGFGSHAALSAAGRSTALAILRRQSLRPQPSR